MRARLNILFCSSLFLLASCKSSFEPIDYGNEACVNCKMTIVDHRFAAEMVSEKGKVYKFDDISCMRLFADDYGDISKNARYFVAVYNGNKNEFTDATLATYLRSDFFASPMNGNYAAFVNDAMAIHMKDSLKVEFIKWQKLK